LLLLGAGDGENAGKEENANGLQDPNPRITSHGC